MCDCTAVYTDIRQADAADLFGIMELIRSCVRHMESRGILQWDELYPDETTIAAGIDNQELFLLERDGRLSVVTLNEYQEPAYLSVDWHYPGKALVVHRLAVDPNFQGRGLGRELMRFSHKFARKRGYDTIRLDAFSGNPAAVALYERLGYRRAGSVHFRKGELFCYELEVK